MILAKLVLRSKRATKHRTLAFQLDSSGGADCCSLGTLTMQIHLSVAGPNALSVMWATGKAHTYEGSSKSKNTFDVPSVVRWGTTADALVNNATGSAAVSGAFPMLFRTVCTLHDVTISTLHASVLVSRAWTGLPLPATVMSLELQDFFC